MYEGEWRRPILEFSEAAKCFALAASAYGIYTWSLSLAASCRYPRRGGLPKRGRSWRKRPARSFPMAPASEIAPAAPRVP